MIKGSTADQNCSEEQSSSQIYKAVLEKNHEQLAMLLRNAKFDEINSEVSGESALDIAATQGDDVAVELLLANGAIPDYKRPNHTWSRSTLSRAIISGNLKTIQLLVTQGCDPDIDLDIFNEDDRQQNYRLNKIPTTISYNYWYKIIELYHLSIFQVVLECKGRKIINDQWSQNMLMLACYLGSYAIIVYLLDQGVSIESTDENGWTCLFYGIPNWNVSVIELLLARGANVNHKDVKGRTVLHIVVNYKEGIWMYQTRIIKLLMNKGANINATDVNGLTPINMAFTATSVHHTAIWILLKQENIDLAKPGINGVTPLHRAVSFKFLSSHIKILVGLDVDINARDNEGKTPLQSIDNFEAILNIPLLLELGANSEDLNYYPKTWFENNEFLKSLEKYRLKRRIANLSKDENVDNILARYCVFSGDKEYAGLIKECSYEIEMMKKQPLCDNLTYYDFLHAKKRTFIKIAKNHILCEVFTDFTYGFLHGFCNYAFMLCKNLLSGARPLTPTESKAMNNAEENLNVIFNNKLPNLVTYNIKKYIEIEDMMTLDNMNLFSLNNHKNNIN